MCLCAHAPFSIYFMTVELLSLARPCLLRPADAAALPSQGPVRSFITHRLGSTSICRLSQSQMWSLPFWLERLSGKAAPAFTSCDPLFPSQCLSCTCRFFCRNPFVVDMRRCLVHFQCFRRGEAALGIKCAHAFMCAVWKDLRHTVSIQSCSLHHYDQWSYASLGC